MWRFFIFLLSSALFAAAPPQLTQDSAKEKLQEILREHLSYKDLSAELVSRSIKNFIEDVDPLKIYLIEDEVVKWTSLSNADLLRIKTQIDNGDFSVFRSIQEAVISSFSRREELEKQLTPPGNPAQHWDEFHKGVFVKTQGELLGRLQELRNLQHETAKKWREEDPDLYMRLADKRRKKWEDDLMGKTTQEREQILLSFSLKALASALDAHTAYLTPHEAEQFIIAVQRRFCGIGAALRDAMNGFTIASLIENGPAQKQGKLKIGDRIIAIDGTPAVNFDLPEIVERLHGEEGAPVHLTVLRPMNEGGIKREDRLDVEIIRGEVVLTEQRYESEIHPYGDGAFAVLRLFSFYEDSQSSSARDLQNELRRLKALHSLKGVILDLRGNTGGYLSQAAPVCGLFIHCGVIGMIQGTGGEGGRLRQNEDECTWDGPLLILTDRITASASELVAGTLQDYGRALIVGDETTFGKGTFQNFSLERRRKLKLNPQGEYKVTRGIFYTVSGKTPQLEGIKADLPVPSPFAFAEIGERFERYPIQNSRIDSAFQDDLSDIPPKMRAIYERYYMPSLQKPLKALQTHLALLKKNSAERISNNQNYQNFLKVANGDSEQTHPFGADDLQLQESLEIMKDLLVLSAEQKLAS